MRALVLWISVEQCCSPTSHAIDWMLVHLAVGCGFTIAAAIVMERDCSAGGKGQRSQLPVVCIQGDSAFGFSGMEFETACR